MFLTAFWLLHFALLRLVFLDNREK